MNGRRSRVRRRAWGTEGREQHASEFRNRQLSVTDTKEDRVARGGDRERRQEKASVVKPAATGFLLAMIAPQDDVYVPPNC